MSSGFGSLNVGELKKYDWRVDLFREKIKNKTPFKLNSGKEVTLKKDQTYNLLKTDLKGFGGAKPKHTFTTINNINLKLSDFQKSKEFGGGGGTSSGNKTALQEVGVLILVDMILQKSNSLPEYTPSKRLSVTTDIDSVKTFLLENKDWFNSCMSSAKTIISSFPDIKKYTMHHDDTKFNSIRSKGKKLSKASTADKWNPSDIYFIKNYNLNFNDIFTFNDYVSNEKNMIGISLKKGSKEAMHGSYSLANLSSMYGIPFVKSTFNSIEDAKPEIQKLFNSMLSRKYYVKTKAKTIEEGVNSLEPKSTNFLISIIPQLHFFSKVKKDELEEILKTAILTSMSMAPFSCKHWKLEGKVLTSIPKDNKVVEIGKIILPLNGDINTLIEFKFNRKNMLCSLRSKGSQPQFNILKSSFSGKIVPISSLK